MSIKPNFSIQHIIKKNREVYNHIFNTILDTLERTLMNVVEKAKSGAYATDPDHEYVDRSGHLRQSVGYVIYHNGEMVRSSFSSGTGGELVGLEYAQSKASEAKVDGFVCVLVAGKHYARYVENKGFDVITGAFLHFDEAFRSELQNTNEQLKGYYEIIKTNQ